ncbi:MAG: sensor histidine kinase, partial [Bdellovibrionota bacterium]
RDRIFQVLLNLISNAIKFTNPGGRIEVLGCALDDRVQFRIKDTGRGIPSEEIPFVFERFWQSQHARANGVGLGLYIARGIVDAHGGRIWAESAVGKGTAIFFELPKSERN